MRFMIKAVWDMDKGNALIRSGAMSETIQKIVKTIQPEAAYFVTEDGNRAAIFVVEMDDAAQMPAIAEPMFLALNARVSFQPAMTPADLDRAGHGIQTAVEQFT